VLVLGLRQGHLDQFATVATTSVGHITGTSEFEE
jgi:hypothetical protein